MVTIVVIKLHEAFRPVSPSLLQGYSSLGYNQEVTTYDLGRCRKVRWSEGG